MCVDFDLEFFDSLDSTSSYALKKINNSSLSRVLVVCALEQTKGRGRFSRIWKSPKGNIYLSFAIPLNLNISSLARDCNKLNLISILSGVIVARWILNKFNIRITLKWPNDIFFAGRKLGGILCESQIKGSILEAIVIGIGININHTPVIEDKFYEAICIKDILKEAQEYDVKVLIKDFANFFYKTWNNFFYTLDTKDIINEFNNFSLEIGHLYIDSLNQFFKYQGISENGELVLNNFVDNNNNIKIISVNNEYKWIYQFFSDKKYLPITVGYLDDKYIHIALFDNFYNLNISLEYKILIQGEQKDFLDLEQFLDKLNLYLLRLLNVKDIVKWPIFIAFDNNVDKLFLNKSFKNFYFVPIQKRSLMLSINEVSNIQFSTLCAIEHYLFEKKYKIIILLNLCISSVSVDIIDVQKRKLVCGINFNKFKNIFTNIGDLQIELISDALLENDIKTFIYDYKLNQNNYDVSNFLISFINFVKTFLHKKFNYSQNDIEVILLKEYLNILEQSSDLILKLDNKAVINGVKIMALGGMV